MKHMRGLVTPDAQPCKRRCEKPRDADHCHGRNRWNPGEKSAQLAGHTPVTRAVRPCDSGFEDQRDDHRPTAQLPSHKGPEDTPGHLLQLDGVMDTFSKGVFERLDDPGTHLVED